LLRIVGQVYTGHRQADRPGKKMFVQILKKDAVGWLTLLASLSFGMLCSSPTAGQSSGDPAKAQMQEMTRRELQLSGPANDKGRADDPKRSQAMMAQVSEDFQRILTLHNEIVRAVKNNQPLQNQYISDATGEIRKRAARLQTSLKLGKPDPATDHSEPQAELKEMQTNDQLILLCKQIEIFVKNPIIEKPGTIDAAELGNARRDLERVVELSEAIKKQVDKLKP
jgi:hypothetical protein